MCVCVLQQTGAMWRSWGVHGLRWASGSVPTASNAAQAAGLRPMPAPGRWQKHRGQLLQLGLAGLCFVLSVKYANARSEAREWQRLLLLEQEKTRTPDPSHVAQPPEGAVPASASPAAADVAELLESAKKLALRNLEGQMKNISPPLAHEQKRSLASAVESAFSAEPQKTKMLW